MTTLTQEVETAVVPEEPADMVQKFKRRMLSWPNPVEFVNNMYGTHPGDDGDYFSTVFRKDS